MKKHYLKITLITWVIYFIVWLIRMFVEWGYVNPFDWLAKIPYESGEYRGKVIFFLILLEFMKAMILIGSYYNPKSEADILIEEEINKQQQRNKNNQE